MAAYAIGQRNTGISVKPKANHSLRVALALCAISLLAFTVQASGFQTPTAQADYCNPNGPGFSCFWSEVNLPKETRRYFSAGVTLRNWIDEEVADGYGGTVSNKCANIQATNGAVAQVACGAGQPFGFTPTNYRPGYVFIVHSAPGPRTILGAAYQQ